MGETGEVPIEVAESAQKVKIEKDVEIDVRDYFALGKFQKRGEAIDPTHPWNTVRYEGVWIENEFGTIVVGETYDAEVAQTSKEPPFGLLIAEQTKKDGQASSVFIRDLNQSQRGYVMEAIRIIAPCLPDEARHKFIRNIIQELPSLKDEEFIFRRLAEMALELIPDYENIPQAKQTFQWPELKDKTPTEEQQKQLTNFINLVARKMPSDRFAERMEDFFQNDLAFIDDPYGTNYQSIFIEMIQWVLKERKDTQRNSELLKKGRPEEYTIKDKVTRPIRSEEELEKVLRSLPVEPMPDTRGRFRTNKTPELVELDRVVGGTGIETWLVSDSEGRGLTRIFKLALMFQEDEEVSRLLGGIAPIEFIEFNRKYYVGDGRHRVAALKALGVAKVPAMVTHIK